MLSHGVRCFSCVCVEFGLRCFVVQSLFFVLLPVALDFSLLNVEGRARIGCAGGIIYFAVPYLYFVIGVEDSVCLPGRREPSTEYPGSVEVLKNSRAFQLFRFHLASATARASDQCATGKRSRAFATCFGIDLAKCF